MHLNGLSCVLGIGCGMLSIVDNVVSISLATHVASPLFL